jgi:diketogulonate reductase-like aldo/keto reductase
MGYRVIYKPPEDNPEVFEESAREDSVVIEIAKKYDATPVQVILAWGMKREICVISRTEI